MNKEQGFLRGLCEERLENDLSTPLEVTTNKKLIVNSQKPVAKN